MHHPHKDALVVIAKIANNIIHKMLVDNGTVANILFWDVYQKSRLMQVDLGLMTTPLYGFIGDRVIPRGTIKLAATLMEHLQVVAVVIEFLTVNCPSTFNGVIGRPLLRALKAGTSIHYLIMKFPTAVGTGQVRGK